MRIISGHQPTYLPWLGLFHKWYLSDAFVYMDTVQYLEQDWNNRNKIRTPTGWQWLSVPIDRQKTKGKLLPQIYLKGHDSPQAKHFWQTEHFKAIEYNYRHAPFFPIFGEKLKEIYHDTVWEKLVDLCFAQFTFFIEALDLKGPELFRMSKFEFSGEKDELILDHCRKLGGTHVIFGEQGKNYVRVDMFQGENIKVLFQEYSHPTYSQRYSGFESHLSVIDLLFNHGEKSREILLSNNLKREDLLDNQIWENE